VDDTTTARIIIMMYANTDATVRTIDKINPFFAIFGFSSFNIRYIIKPPIIPKKIGARYHALLFDLVSDILYTRHTSLFKVCLERVRV